MALIASSTYRRPPFYQFNGHLQTILPALTRRIEAPYERERIDLPDGDFLDLDWIDRSARRLIILTHGLEGNAQRHYIKGMARQFAALGWDILAWNCRSCGGEMNRAQRMYHHGDTDDIAAVIRHALRTKDYASIALIGFSMGGSISMKYLGLQGAAAPDPIRRCIAYSTPCDLQASIRTLEQPGNRFYKNRFLTSLREKMRLKAEAFPGVIDFGNFEKIEVWRDFDLYFTAPLNGFDSPEAFYEFASAKNFMAGIRVPTLLVNAENDPILDEDCTPRELCRNHPYIYLETPLRGGHVGFALPGKTYTWSEKRAVEFVGDCRPDNRQPDRRPVFRSAIQAVKGKTFR